MKHQLEFWHGERALLVRYLTESAPYVPQLKSTVMLQGLPYFVGEVRSIFGTVYENNMALGEGWLVQVIVFRTEAELPTSPQFGR